MDIISPPLPPTTTDVKHLNHLGVQFYSVETAIKVKRGQNTNGKEKKSTDGAHPLFAQHCKENALTQP